MCPLPLHLPLRFLSELLGPPEVTKSGNYQFQELECSSFTSRELVAKPTRNLPSVWVDIPPR